MNVVNISTLYRFKSTENKKKGLRHVFMNCYLLCIHMQRKGSCWCAATCTVHMSHSH